MNFKTKFYLYTYTLVLLSIILGIIFTNIYYIKTNQKVELKNMLEEDSVINICKERYFQDYKVKNNLVIILKENGTTRDN